MPEHAFCAANRNRIPGVRSGWAVSVTPMAKVAGKFSSEAARAALEGLGGKILFEKVGV